MRKTLPLAALAAAALALTACGASDDTENAAPVVDVQTASAQTWADEKMEQWFTVEGASGVEQLYEPFNKIKFWEAGEPGELVITVDSSITATDEVYLEDLGPANDLWLVSAVMLDQVDQRAPELEKVTTRTEDRSRSETYTREDQARIAKSEAAAGQ